MGNIELKTRHKKIDLIKGKDSEIGIDITYCHELRTLWLRFLCWYLTIKVTSIK